LTTTSTPEQETEAAAAGTTSRRQHDEGVVWRWQPYHPHEDQAGVFFFRFICLCFEKLFHYHGHHKEELKVHHVIHYIFHHLDN
jgi:hypothetical protein